MAAENTVIIDVKLSSEDAAAKAKELAASIKEIKQENAGLKKSGEETSVAYAQNSTQLRTLQAEQKAYITISQNAEGSNNSLRAQLALLTTQYNSLGQAERDNTTAGQGLQTQIKQISDELKRTEGAVGDTRRNVGNYTSAVAAAAKGSEGLSSSLGNVSKGFGFLPSAISAPINGIRAFVETQRNVVVGFQSIKQIQNEATAAQEVATQAAEANTVAQTQFAAGQITAAEAQVANEAATKANTTALLLEAEATTAASEATGLLKIALASTGIGLLLVALGALYTYFKNTNDGAREFAVLSSRASAEADVFTGKIAQLGKTIFSYGKNLDDTDTKQDNTFGSRFERNLDKLIVKAARLVPILQDINAVQRILENSDTGKQAAAAGEAAEAITRRAQAFAAGEREYTNTTRVQLETELNTSRARIRNLDYDLDTRKKYAEDAKKISNQIYNDDLIYLNEHLKNTLAIAEQQKNAGVKIDRQAIAESKGAILRRKQQYDQEQESLDVRESRVDSAARTRDNKLQHEREAAAARQKAGEDKINEDRAKSELATAASILTTREKELEDINLDINKRVALYEKYGQDTTQLERERQARVSQLVQKFHQEDLKTITSNFRATEDLRISQIADADLRRQAQQKAQDDRTLQDTDLQIAAVASRIALGEQGLNDLLQSYADKRSEQQKIANQHQQQAEQENQDKLKAINQAYQQGIYQEQIDALNFEEQQHQQRLQINAELVNSYGGVAGAISDLAGKQTTLGKVALVAQKAFAIAEIIINSERAKSAVLLKYALLETQAAAIPIVGEFLLIGLQVAKATELAAITTQEVASVAVTAAQTIASVAGKAKGGLHYDSDGGGTLLSGPGSGTSDSMNARLSNGEAVINARSTTMFKPLLSEINAAGGGVRFATGGIYAGYNDINALRSQNISAQLTSAQLLTAIRTMPAPIVLVQDINDGLSQQAKVQDNASF